MGFGMSVHGTCRCKRVYNLLCKQRGCGKRFTNVRDWNSHHRLQHRNVTFKCTVCKQVYLMPSSFKDHKYSHHENQFKCHQCRHSFPFKSGIDNHRCAHLTQRLFKCFAAAANPINTHKTCIGMCNCTSVSSSHAQSVDILHTKKDS